jgi:hypothetical protein
MLSLQYMALSMARVAAGGCAEEATACLRLAPMLRVGGKEGGIGHAICAFSAVTELSDVKSVCGSRKTAWRVARLYSDYLCFCSVLSLRSVHTNRNHTRARVTIRDGLTRAPPMGAAKR